MNPEHAKRVEKLEKAIGYSFRDKELPLRAITHSSYANERKINPTECNERLEFLGDAVLELISSDDIFRKYKQMPEGRMSRLRASLVCEPALAESAKRIGLGELILLGKGEAAGGGALKPSVTSDAFEAIIGALYLDGGLEAAKRFTDEFVLYDTDSFLNENDPKSALQELLQKRGSVKIEYRIVSESGPDHERVFISEVSADGEVLGRGEGHKKKDAEKAAAMAALERAKSNTV